jgi:hypothetical protein
VGTARGASEQEQQDRKLMICFDFYLITEGVIVTTHF